MIISFIWSGRAAPLPNFNPIRIETHRYLDERKLSTVQSPSSFLSTLNLNPSQTLHQRMRIDLQYLQDIHKCNRNIQKCKKLRIQAHQKLVSLRRKPYVPTLPSSSTPRRFSMAKPLSVKGLKRMTSRGSRPYRISTRVSFKDLAEIANNIAAGGEALHNVTDKSIQSTQNSKKTMKLYRLYEQQEERMRLAIHNVALQCQITRARMIDLNNDGISGRFFLAKNQLDSTNLHYIQHSLVKKGNSQPFLDHCFCMQNLGLSDPEIILSKGLPFFKASVLSQTGSWIGSKHMDSLKSLDLDQPFDHFIESFFRDQRVLGEAFVSISDIEKSNSEAHNELLALPISKLFSIYLKKGSDRYNTRTPKPYSQTDFNRLLEEFNSIS